MNIATLLPTFVVQEHPEITSLQVGILFSIYQLVALFVSPVAGNWVARIGRKRIIVFSMAV